MRCMNNSGLALETTDCATLKLKAASVVFSDCGYRFLWDLALNKYK